jgi:hypothetical protein
MNIDISEIKKGLPGLTVACGAYLYEGCIVSLKKSGHNNKNTILYVDGDRQEECILIWDDKDDEQLGRAWADQTEATEQGAVCLVILIAINYTGYTVVERAVKGTGFDYWLGNADDILFQKKARLEVSGIFRGNNGLVNTRYRQKTRQTNPSDSMGLPAYVGVVEFSKPLANFGRKL